MKIQTVAVVDDSTPEDCETTFSVSAIWFDDCDTLNECDLEVRVRSFAQISEKPFRSFSFRLPANGNVTSRSDLFARTGQQLVAKPTNNVPIFFPQIHFYWISRVVFYAGADPWQIIAQKTGAKRGNLFLLYPRNTFLVNRAVMALSEKNASENELVYIYGCVCIPF